MNFQYFNFIGSGLGSVMGSVSSKVNIDVIQDQVKADPVVVYSKTKCGFCSKAKDLLKENHVGYKERNLDEIKQDYPKDYPAMVNGLVYTTHQTSVPQIFICGKFVGGFTELQKISEAGGLLAAVAECTGENARVEQ